MTDMLEKSEICKLLQPILWDYQIHPVDFESNLYHYDYSYAYSYPTYYRQKEKNVEDKKAKRGKKTRT